MKFKVTFNRVVEELQKVEGVIEADNQEAALEAFHSEDFQRLLVVRRDLQNMNTGKPEFEQIT